MNYSNDKILMYCCYGEVVVIDGYAKGVKHSGGLDGENCTHVIECLYAPKPLDYLYNLFICGLHFGYF